jgi:hypothetical protein
MKSLLPPINTKAVSLTTYLVLILIAGLIAISIDPLPTWILSRHPDWTALEPTQRLQSEATLRTTLVQAIAGLVVTLGAMTALKQLALTRRQTQATLESQYGDTFSRAITQLSSDAVTVRVGGVYALDRLLDSELNGQEQVMDVLQHFIRHESTINGSASPAAEAAIRRLAARSFRANLTGAGLPRADMSNLNLDGFCLVDCDLREADLRGSTLNGTDLSRADLSRALVDRAALSAATTIEARGL